MNNQTNNETQRKRYGQLGFYAVLALCSAMIAAACWFACTQTTDDLSMQLESALDSAQQFTAAELQPTEPPTERIWETTAREAAVPVVPEASAEATLPPSQPATEPAAVVTAAKLPVFPVKGEQIAAFSGGELVKSATTGVWQTHNGMDIACEAGTEIRAMDAGVVSAVEEDPLWGVCVTIDHQNGVFSRYCSLDADVAVNTGDSVSHGMVIGKAGGTADIESAMDSHIHFEVMQGETYIDPAAYIAGE
ncbi:MAG: M23 family metallopeptidase [Oscillospiraceae bacterium]|nr:M23 family metallopeptidase [Oscillospiraceae bacterium]